MSEEKVEIALPADCVSIVNVTYIHGVGTSIRSVSIPSATEEDFVRFLSENGMSCGHDMPILWQFVAIWPDKGMSYHMVCHDQHEAAQVLSDIRLVRTSGDPSPFLSHNPVTGDLVASVAEHNDWITGKVSGESSGIDFRELNAEPDFSGLEDFLTTVSNENNDEGEQ